MGDYLRWFVALGLLTAQDDAAYLAGLDQVSPGLNHRPTASVWCAGVDQTFDSEAGNTAHLIQSGNQECSTT